MKASNAASMAGVFLALTAFTAQAGVDIQSAQFKEDKGVLYVKGKADADKVYVVNASTNAKIGEISVRNGDFRADMRLGNFTPVPCTVQVQTNAPGASAAPAWGAWGSGQTTSSDPGEFSILPVRHAPANCSK